MAPQKKSADEIARTIKDEVNHALLDKTIDRPTLIEAFEDVASDLESVLESLRDDERRANERRAES